MSVNQIETPNFLQYGSSSAIVKYQGSIRFKAKQIMCNSLLFLSLLLVILGPFHNIMDMVRSVKGRKERVLNQIFGDYLV